MGQASHSLNKLSDLRLKLLQSGLKTHVHELSLSVHLQTALDGWVDRELELEFFASVVWVGFQSSEHLVLL